MVQPFRFYALFGNNVWLNIPGAIASLYYGMIIPASVKRVTLPQIS
jgi:hypothetical protein